MTTTYKLKTPVTHNNVTYSELIFRKATIGDLMITDNFKGELSKMIAILSATSDVPMPAFKMIEAEDFAAMQALVDGETGEPSEQEQTGA